MEMLDHQQSLKSVSASMELDRHKELERKARLKNEWEREQYYLTNKQAVNNNLYN